MQPSYDALLDDFPPFLYSPEPLAKEIPTDPWYSFHAALDNQLPDALASGTPSHSFAALPLSYGSSSSTDSDFYGYNGLDDFAGSPTSDSSSYVLRSDVYALCLIFEQQFSIVIRRLDAVSPHVRYR